MEMLKKHKEFIEGMKLGNCPNPDNQKLIEVVEAAKTVGITEKWVCTCEPSFNKWVNELHEYCTWNVWGGVKTISVSNDTDFIEATKTFEEKVIDGVKEKIREDIINRETNFWNRSPIESKTND